MTRTSLIKQTATNYMKTVAKPWADLKTSKIAGSKAFLACKDQLRAAQHQQTFKTGAKPKKATWCNKYCESCGLWPSLKICDNCGQTERIIWHSQAGTTKEAPLDFRHDISQIQILLIKSSNFVNWRQTCKDRAKVLPNAQGFSLGPALKNEGPREGLEPTLADCEPNVAH